MRKKEKIGFIVVCVLMNLLFIGYSIYNSYIDLQVYTSNHFLSSMATELVFEEGVAVENKYLLESLKDTQGVAFRTLIYKTDVITVYGLAGEEAFEYAAKVSEKVNVSENANDLSGQNTAFIGKNLLSTELCETDENGNLYLIINNQKYLVTNVFSLQMNNMLDNVAFVKMKPDEILSSQKLYVDSESSEQINTVISRIEEKYNFYLSKVEENFIENYSFDRPFVIVFNSLLLIFLTGLLISLSVFTISAYSEEIKIKHLIGIPRKKIIVSVFMPILTLWLINVVISSFLYIFICEIIISKHFLALSFSKLLLFSVAIIIFLGMALLIYTLTCWRRCFKKRK